MNWIKDILNNRPQRVVDDECAEEAAVTSRVPQGIVLGPNLFLVCINDMPEQMNSTCLLFTDVSIIYRYVKAIADCY